MDGVRGEALQERGHPLRIAARGAASDNGRHALYALECGEMKDGRRLLRDDLRVVVFQSET